MKLSVAQLRKLLKQKEAEEKVGPLLRKKARLERQLAKLEKQIAKRTGKVGRRRRKGRRFSAATRAKMRKAQRARWAKLRKKSATKKAPAPVAATPTS
jgi:DNA-binding transcriptional MerR regulator